MISTPAYRLLNPLYIPFPPAAKVGQMTAVGGVCGSAVVVRRSLEKAERGQGKNSDFSLSAEGPTPRLPSPGLPNRFPPVQIP